MIKAAVMGARGKMGALACSTVEASDEFELVAAVDKDDDRGPLVLADVAVDLTHPGAVMGNVAWCLDHEVDVVVGTSGFDASRLDETARLLETHPERSVVVVPNFSIGAVLMMRMAAQAAPFFESVEVVELHHPDKVDAPSGTALRTAHEIADARREAGLGPGPDATRDDPRGTRGGRVDDVPVHSVRLRGLTAHQEVLLGNTGETLTLRHDMPDRAASMPGVLAAMSYAVRHPGLTVGLDRVLGLD